MNSSGLDPWNDGRSSFAVYDTPRNEATRATGSRLGTASVGLMLDRSVARGKVLILNPDFKLIRPNPRGSSARCKPLDDICDKISIVKSRERVCVVIFLIPYEVWIHRDIFISEQTLEKVSNRSDKIISFLLPDASLDIASQRSTSTLSAFSMAGRNRVEDSARRRGGSARSESRIFMEISSFSRRVGG